MPQVLIGTPVLLRSPAATSIGSSALFMPPLGVFTQVGLTQPLRINLVIYLFAVGGLGFQVLFGMWPAAVIHALFVILTRK